MNHLLTISTDFSLEPGARYYSDGPKSGQEFFEKLLDERFSKALEANAILTVDLDNTEGYATSFFDEAFTRLAEKYGAQKTWDHLKIISIAEPEWIELIKSYIFEVKGN